MLDITNMSNKYHRLQIFTFIYNALQFLIPSNVCQHLYFTFVCRSGWSYSMLHFRLFIYKEKLHRTVYLIEKNSISTCFCSWWFLYIFPYMVTLFFIKWQSLPPFKQEIKTFRLLVLICYHIFCFIELSVFQNINKLNLLYVFVYLILMYYFIFYKICDMASGLSFNIFFWNENTV